MELAQVGTVGLGSRAERIGGAILAAQEQGDMRLARGSAVGKRPPAAEPRGQVESEERFSDTRIAIEDREFPAEEIGLPEPPKGNGLDFGQWLGKEGRAHDVVPCETDVLI